MYLCWFGGVLGGYGVYLCWFGGVLGGYGDVWTEECWRVVSGGYLLELDSGEMSRMVVIGIE